MDYLNFNHDWKDGLFVIDLNINQKMRNLINSKMWKLIIDFFP